MPYENGRSLGAEIRGARLGYRWLDDPGVYVRISDLDNGFRLHLAPADGIPEPETRTPRQRVPLLVGDQGPQHPTRTHRTDPPHRARRPPPSTTPLIRRPRLRRRRHTPNMTEVPYCPRSAGTSSKKSPTSTDAAGLSAQWPDSSSPRSTSHPPPNSAHSPRPSPRSSASTGSSPSNPKPYPARTTLVAMPGGRPTSLTQVVSERTTEDGTTIRVTVADRIIEAVRAGTPLEGAAHAAGINNETFWRWLRDGARANRDLIAGKKPKELTADQRRLAEFCEEVHRAAGEWEANSNLVLERLARGGTRVVTVTEKVDAAGNVLERTQKTETLGPSAAVIQWRLSRRFPDRYANRVEMSGPGGEPIPIESRARSLADALRDFQSGAETQRELTEESSDADA